MRNSHSMNFTSKKYSRILNFITKNKTLRPQLCRNAKQENDNVQASIFFWNFVLFHSPQWKLRQSVTQEQFGYSISGLLSIATLMILSATFLTENVKYRLWRFKPNGGRLEHLTSIYSLYMLEHLVSLQYLV